MTARVISLASLTMLLLASCAATLQDPVVAVVKGSKENDGKFISLAGVLREKNGFFNLFSKDGEECVGVLLTDQQRNDYRASAGKRVTLTGTLEAEGCGRDGICVEHLCGPTILTNITALR